MGLFILGILVGWLAEWVFFRFFMNNDSKSNHMEDYSDLKHQLSEKDSVIDSLKASLLEVESTQGKKDSNVDDDMPSSNTDADNESLNSDKSSTEPSPENQGVSEKVVVKKESAKKSAKKSSTAKVTTKTSSPKKTSLKKSTSINPAGDDLTKLSGIGPSMAAKMAELGITSYKKLAAMDDDILRDMLEASGARLNNNKEAMDSWNEQATLADKGDFEGLKKLQDELKKR